MENIYDPRQEVPGTLNLAARNALRIFAALALDKPIRFIYTDEDGIDQVREATPAAITRSMGGNTYMTALDANRQDYRSFRLDRILFVAA